MEVCRTLIRRIRAEEFSAGFYKMDSASKFCTGCTKSATFVINGKHWQLLGSYSNTIYSLETALPVGPVSLMVLIDY